MKKIVDRFVKFFKLKIKEKPKNIEEVSKPQVKRLSYSKRTDN